MIAAWSLETTASRSTWVSHGRSGVAFQWRGLAFYERLRGFAGGEEVRDRQPGQDVDDRARLLTAEVRLGERGEEGVGEADDAGQALDSELAQGRTRLRGQAQGEVLVRPQLLGGRDDSLDEQVLEI